MRTSNFIAKIATQQNPDDSRRNSSCSVSTHNSFLVEIDYNGDIDENIRLEINSRFNRSLVNATYKFPRVSYHPFPSISLQQKSAKREGNRKGVRMFRPFKLVSHTPKPSLSRSIKLSQKYRQRASPSPDSEIRGLSVTPTPVSITGKVKKKMDFPKLRKMMVKTPTPGMLKSYKKTLELYA
jgi:hypothetical protein